MGMLPLLVQTITEDLKKDLGALLRPSGRLKTPEVRGEEGSRRKLESSAAPKDRGTEPGEKERTSSSKKGKKKEKKKKGAATTRPAGIVRSTTVPDPNI